MFEKALSGGSRYWAWIFFLLAGIGAGFIAYMKQLNEGLGITGLSRDVSWGLYIVQFTFLDGIAASAVMLVVPYYLHNYKKFGKIVVLAEFLAVSSVIMCMLFILADLGQPARVMNMILHPTPGSVMFWDAVVLSGYLFLNIIIGWTTLAAEKKQVAAPKWVKPLIYLSIPWAFSVMMVSAFLYAGLPGRHLWLNAILAARFIASAFAGGPALLILLALLIKKLSRFDPGEEAIQSLAKIVTYAMCADVFFFLLELFTAFYSGIPALALPIKYLFVGLEGHTTYVPWLWSATVLAIAGIVLLINPGTRRNEVTLIAALAAIIIASWIGKGMGLIAGVFVPNSFDRVTEYSPTVLELVITFGIYAVGLLVLTVLYKVAVAVREETA